MARAKQARRLARTWATALGTTSGIAEVDAYLLDEQIRNPENFDVMESLRGLSRLGSWDEGALSAGAARFDGCPAGFEDTYYAAYDRAACERVRELRRNT